jgi:2-polyprenyl-6-methoxyphenol hydroxylase-like FAD-dependent oxidoreductase
MTGPIAAEVLVVGAGPCGLMLANELGRRGVAVVVVNERPTTTPHPQANATQARTMEYFRRLGFADRIRAQGLPPTYPTDIAYFTRFTGWELARFKLPTSATARNLARQLSGSWSAAELPHRCSQIYIERVLREEADRLPSVTLLWDRRAIAVAEGPDGVTLQTERSGGGEPQAFTAPYLVGADGPRSIVRKTLGIDYVGQRGEARDFLGGRMHAVYFRCPGLYEAMRCAPAWLYWTVNRDRRSILGAIDGVGEFVFHTQLTDAEAAAEITDEMARGFFEQALGVAIGAGPPIEIISRLSWHAGAALVARHMQSHRLFLAGDAAHLFTPTGGLGYNTAIEDAVNLAWKLAASVQGWGGDSLLQSYETERRPIAERNTGHARRFAESVGGFVPPEALESDTAEGAAARADAGAYLDAHARAEFNIPGITFGVRYDFSPIIAPDGSEPPPDTVNTYVPTACPGGRAPHLWLADGASLYDRLGFEFTLLQLCDDAALGLPLIEAAAALGIPLTTLAIGVAGSRGLYGADLALIRPDQIVAWRGDRAPADPLALLRKLVGRTA